MINITFKPGSILFPYWLYFKFYFFSPFPLTPCTWARVYERTADACGGVMVQFVMCSFLIF